MGFAGHGWSWEGGQKDSKIPGKPRKNDGGKELGKEQMNHPKEMCFGLLMRHHSMDLLEKD